MSQFNQLSAREWEVIEQLLQGKSNKLIASSLNISVSTVEFHLNNIYEKFNVNSRLELILALWKTTGKMVIEELGISTVDSQEEVTENVERQSANLYRRIRKTMRIYRLVLITCVIAFLLPLILLFIEVIRRPDSIIIWRGILIWLLPAAAILILLFLFPRMSFQFLAKIAGIFFVVLLGGGLLVNHKTGLIFDFINLRFWLFPYLIGAGGILIAARYRTREPDPGRPDAE